jgi:hypothetical protein
MEIAWWTAMNEIRADIAASNGVSMLAWIRKVRFMVNLNLNNQF